MNAFEMMIGGGGLYGEDLGTIQLNLGLRCNQSCRHCHVGASPQRTEMMAWPTMEAIVRACQSVKCGLVDLTGGSPELNPHFRRFVRAVRRTGCPVQVRTNLTVLLESGMDVMPEFFRAEQVRLVASMPCYLEENVSAQRGPGVYEKSVEAIRRLNALGYGVDEDLPLNLVYNPGGPSLPPEQGELEADYRRELDERFGIRFTRLFTIANMPIGRFLASLRERQEERAYRRILSEAFNPATLEGLMCRHQISVGWDGTLYDCDFNLALGLSVDHGAPDHIARFDASLLSRRRIVTDAHCFGCTAGCGSSCGGALAPSPTEEKAAGREAR